MSQDFNELNTNEFENIYKNDFNFKEPKILKSFLPEILEGRYFCRRLCKNCGNKWKKI